MKREHIALPTLKAAAAAYLARESRDTDLAPTSYCVDTTTSKVVASHNCQGETAVEGFEVVEGSSGLEIGATMHRRRSVELEDMTEQQLKDLLETMAFKMKLEMLQAAAGGFCVRRDTCGNDRHYAGHGGGGGTAIFVYGRPGGSRGMGG